MSQTRGRYYEFRSMHGFANINFKENTPTPSLKTLKEALQQWCSTKSKRALIKYIAIGKTTKGPNRHAHIFFELEEMAHTRKKPFIQINNEQHFIFFEKVTENANYDGSFKAIIEYLKRQAKKHPESGAVFEEDGKMNNNRGRLGDIDIGKALKMTDLEEAHAYLKNISLKGYMNNVQKFDSMWAQEHSRDNYQRIKIKLQPWKEDNPVVKNSRIWLNSALSGKTKRVKTLVIVSETKMGKTEFVNDLLKDLKVDEFRGRFMMDGHNESLKYDIRIFDDANLNDIIWPEFKSLISTRGEQITVNVKYSHARVTSLPTILVLNPGSWKALQQTAKEYEDFDWLEKNSVVLQTKEKLFKEPPPNPELMQDKSKYEGLDPKLVEMLLENEVEEDLILDDMGDDTIDELDGAVEQLEQESLPPPLQLEQPIIDEEPTKRIAVDDHEIYKKFFDVSKNIISQQGKNKYITTQSGKKIKIASRDNSEEEESEDDPEELASRWTGGNF
ncbi:hypothetical protein EDI_082040 [Entamoeba dispar SAW760]|uniref:Geminivirus AL1 replication-associated protein catalytic domain-containing protein n=1 Tax=Entamoeba dispar (strain ATCC PRA-260 / SAW760) TaxID=370354 RepID=B0ELM0_ENTDS|nr:uncharacterized protein EDI_082040 [Entamoeba dispar SAW760]EDR24579.1 hypothetical protein EDI_082040 [Entamoeba dispar SAW760]|eukprot:EDR24579.1 hypothetical protein EDI_082040 [Entamoeba dispar SAW760]